MQTFRELEEKLAKAKKYIRKSNPSSARYPTGIVIDLGSPEGNIFYILGVCHRAAHDLRLDANEVAKFTKETQKKNYDEILDICRKWFGVIFIK